VLALLGAVGYVLDGEYGLIARLDPTLPPGADWEPSAGALAMLAIGLVSTLLAVVLGGVAGNRCHRRLALTAVPGVPVQDTSARAWV
jgi:hypothetical protein